MSKDIQFRIEYDRPHFCVIDTGNEYPTLVRCPRNGKKKVVLTKYDYVSLAEESDFYIVDFTADERESNFYTEYHKIRNDSLELRWYNRGSDIRYDPRLAPKKSITIKFHDGLLAGTKLIFEGKDKISIGRSPDCDIVLPVPNLSSNSMIPS